MKKILLNPSSISTIDIQLRGNWIQLKPGGVEEFDSLTAALLQARYNFLVEAKELSSEEIDSIKKEFKDKEEGVLFCQKKGCEFSTIDVNALDMHEKHEHGIKPGLEFETSEPKTKLNKE